MNAMTVYDRRKKVTFREMLFWYGMLSLYCLIQLVGLILACSEAMYEKVESWFWIRMFEPPQFKEWRILNQKVEELNDSSKS